MNTNVNIWSRTTSKGLLGLYGGMRTCGGLLLIEMGWIQTRVQIQTGWIRIRFGFKQNGVDLDSDSRDKGWIRIRDA